MPVTPRPSPVSGRIGPALYAARKRDLAAAELQLAMLHKPSPTEQNEIKDLAEKLRVPPEPAKSR